jgi:hypothetical protein
LPEEHVYRVFLWAEVTLSAIGNRLQTIKPRTVSSLKKKKIYKKGFIANDFCTVNMKTFT